MKVQNICCIGAGYVGGPTMAVIAKKCPDIKVTVVDINEARIAAWNDENVENIPVYEPGLPGVVAEARGRNLFFSTDVDKAIDEAQMIFISVNTPTKTYGEGKGQAADLKWIELCARQIARVAKEKKIVVEKSTLPVRTASALKDILEHTGNGINFQILSNPEFLAEGTAVEDLMAPDRVLIGGDQTEEGLDAINSLVDVYARSCFQKDILNLVYISRSYGLDEVADYWEQVIIMNDHQKKRFAKKIIKNLYNTVSGKKIAFLGWAFKKDTNDTRESAAIYVADHLLNEQSKVSVFDPKVTEQQIYSDLDYLGSRNPGENKESLTVDTDPYRACNGAHAIAVLTEWDEFKTYDWQKIYDNMLKPAHVFDGRNIMDKKALQNIGFQVHSIGSADDN